MMLKNRPISVRAAVSASAVLALALTAVVVVFAYVLAASNASSARESAYAQAQAWADRVADGTPVSQIIDESLRAGAELQVVSRERVEMGEFSSLAHKPWLPAQAETGELSVGSARYEVVAVPAGDARIVVAVAVETETVRTAVVVLAALAVAMWGAATAVTYVAVKRSLRPVARMTADVQAISDAGGSERVSVPPSHDEIARLATTMNAMLERLARSDEARRRFVADASHELRSPIATLQAHVETAPDAGAGEVRVHRNLALSELERLGGLVSDMLTLARADDAGVAAEFFDVSECVAGEVSRLRGAGRDVHATIDYGPVRGDQAALNHVLRNLGDNALRYSSGWIALRMETDGAWVKIHVDNEGTPIPQAMREKIFDRFVRLDEHRGRDEGGSGLGLAIASTLAGAMGATLTTGVGPDGNCRFTVSLPLAKEE
ncbi:signal transduction histidine kinase [Arcanobacterium wilhelmae]|uniref:histidine kinase n=1 Tax=Arcanobacterium wilhelmae TaxID=1803177 RepID=A0ABT9NCZ8_9ACTO|nr:HAMP domain-containing sensor histidine kinase [Arcanobacterium wilhelmae]MDP9801599.1 signal transduction histidine kinase [Arcanobacterium wilhelmae]WFN90922.1 HAMP domain-containing sensor histidine kinase [Arcanobacterium wilhelmae]